MKRTIIASTLFSIAILAGCDGRTSMIPVTDPDLKKTPPQFAADAARRTYNPNLPSGGKAVAQAEVDHGMFNRFKVINLSDTDWSNVEVWVNGSYVVHLDSWKSKELRKINFQMLYNQQGESFTIDNRKSQVDKIEIVLDGKIYTVPMRLAD